MDLMRLALDLAVFAAAVAGPPRPTATLAVEEIVQRAIAGDEAAPAEIESRLEPLFQRKDLFSMHEARVAEEVARLLGPSGVRPLYRRLPRPLLHSGLLAIDFDGIVGDGAPGSRGYVAYAFVEAPATGDARSQKASVTWYHDLGRRLDEQGGVSWHPSSVVVVDDPGRASPPALVVLESARPGSETVGLLVFSPAGEGWKLSQRITPGSEIRSPRYIGVGSGGAVFTARRGPPKGVLTGAPADLFLASVIYERVGEGFASQPIVAPIPDVVSAAEDLIAAVRSGSKERAVRLCRSPDVLESMLYFSPEWKGGGRVIRASGSTLEFVYEERGRPTLRIEFGFQNASGTLLLASATGRLEEERKP